MNQSGFNPRAVQPMLNQSAAQLNSTQIEQLRDARNLALSKHRALQAAPVQAWLSHHGMSLGASPSGHYNLNRTVFSLLLLIALFSGVSYWQQVDEHDHSEVDIAILTDDLPMDAFVE